MTAAQNVEGEWTGDGQKAAESRASSDEGEISRLAGKLEDAADALTNAGTDVGEPRTSALLRARLLEAAMFSVADDWQVKDVSPLATPSESDSAADKRMREARREEAANSTVSLRSFADAAGEADARHGRTISTALSALDTVIPPSAGLSSTQAAADAEALKNGTATEAQRRRFESATSLSDAQLKALAKGNDAVIPKGQMDYLVDLAGELDEDGGLAAFKEFGGRDTGLKSQLADGMQILSNPHVRTGEVSPVSSTVVSRTQDHTNTAYRRGGLDALPASWSGPLTNSPVELRSSGGTPGPGGQLKSATKLSTIDDLGTISEILDHGSDDARMGTDIDRALIARAGDIAGATNDPDLFYTSPDNPYGMERSEIGEKLNSMLDVAGRDEIAVHDAMMGRDGGPSAVSAMPESYSAPGEKPSYGDPVEFEAGDYDANKTMTNLLSFDWDEKAGHDSGMKGMLDGLRDPDTVIGEAGDPGPSATRAGEASGELARILADNKDALVDVESHGNDSMGQLNPGVSEAAADAVGPHLIDLAGGDASAIGIDGAQQLDGQQQMTDLITVLNMDPDSATSINTHGADAVSYLQQQVGENAEFLPNGDAKSTLEAHQMGRITIGMDEGLQAAGTELDHDKRREVATEYYQEGMQYDAGKSVVSKAVGLAPGGGALTAGGDIINPYIKNELVGQSPYTGELSSDEFEELQDSVEFTVETAQPRNAESYANLLNGYAEKYPEVRDGEMAPYFNDDGVASVPDDTYKKSEFLRDSEDALGRLDDEVAKGAEIADANRKW